MSSINFIVFTEIQNNMKKIVFQLLSLLFASISCLSAGAQKESRPVIISKLPDSLLAIPAVERYERYQLEITDGRSGDSSSLNKKNGLLDIGDYRVNLLFFTDFIQEAVFQKLSWPDSLLYVAEVATGRNETNDTSVLYSKVLTKAQKTRLKATKKRTAFDDVYFNYGFGNDCPPGDCKHYFIGLTSRNNIIRAVNPGELKKLLPRVRNPYDAWFLLEGAFYWPKGKYAKVDDGYLLLLNKRTRDCQIDYADILYHVNLKGKVEELGRVLTQKTNLCF